MSVFEFLTRIKKFYHRKKYKIKISLYYASLKKFERAFSNIAPIPENSYISQDNHEERIFSIWLQGEENAPAIVKACFGSIRANCKQELIVLNEKTLANWIKLPDYVTDKWKKGKIKPAHFTDICRLELLYQHGGIWADATDFIASPFPDWLMKADFFVYHTGDNTNITGYHSFIQNCFIRAKKNNFLVKAWRDAVLIYWEKQNKPKYYFIHQLIFKKIIDCNVLAKSFYNKMPYKAQDATHTLWFRYSNEPFDEEIFNDLTQKALFQKTEYRSLLNKKPIPGSLAEMMINKYSQ